MPRKCAAYGCNTGYDKKKSELIEDLKIETIAKFHFPLKKAELLEKWKQFTNMKKDPGDHSVLLRETLQGVVYQAWEKNNSAIGEESRPDDSN